jgi:hypothetical protein
MNLFNCTACTTADEKFKNACFLFRGLGRHTVVQVWLNFTGALGLRAPPYGAGAGFLQVLRFPLPIFIPPIAPQSTSSIIWDLYNRPEVAAVPSGLSPTPLIIIINNNNMPSGSSNLNVNIKRYPNSSSVYVRGLMGKKL